VRPFFCKNSMMLSHWIFTKLWLSEMTLAVCHFAGPDAIAGD
jgi:hypothetical protein